MRSKKGKKGWMAIKIDLEKAYDRLEWGFVHDTLIDIGLSESFVQLVWYCISSSTMRVQWITTYGTPSNFLEEGQNYSILLLLMILFCLQKQIWLK